MSQNNIKPSEISDVLLKQLESADLSVKLEEVGTVLQISDGVARIFGLTNAESGELLEFDSGVMGVVMNLEVDNVGAVLLGPTDEVKEGMSVKRTGRIVSIPVSEKMLGRVVNPLGVPIDGLGEIAGEKVEMPLDRKAPGVVFRQPVNEPLQTGIKAIDAMILSEEVSVSLSSETDRQERQPLPSIRLLTRELNSKKESLYIVSMWLSVRRVLQ